MTAATEQEIRDAVVKALKEATGKVCPYCAGTGPYSKKPSKSKDYSARMHLAQGYPPRRCAAQALWTMIDEASGV